MSAERVLYSIPSHVTGYLKGNGWDVPSSPMMPHIQDWANWYRCSNSFYDFDDRSGGVTYKVHRLSTRPAVKVCEEWASLLMGEGANVMTDDDASSEWMRSKLASCSFQSLGQRLVQKAFALGTAAWALWFDLDAGRMIPRRYDANQIIPLSWDDDGITECAFCTSCRIGGAAYDQLQVHAIGDGGYSIRTVLFKDGMVSSADGVIGDLDTGCQVPTFSIVKPAIDNTTVDLSPYGQSIFANSIDIIKSVDLAYDAIYNGDVRCGKMRVFLSDMLIEQARDSNGNTRSIPFGRDDATFFRAVSANDDMIKEFAPALRVGELRQAYGLALQTLGDRCGFGQHYFKIDDAGGIRTATEVASDNSCLMRNLKMHSNALQDSIRMICEAMLECGAKLLDAPVYEGDVSVSIEDGIVQDTAAEKAQDLAELGLVLNPWEYRAKWFGEDEQTAKANVPGGIDDAAPIEVE